MGAARLGFRHTWTLPDECDPIAFNRAVSDMDRIIRRLASGAFSTEGKGGRPFAECNGVAMLYLRSDGVALADPAVAGDVFRVDRDIAIEEYVIRNRRSRVAGGEKTTAERRGYFKPLGSPANVAACCCLIILQRHLGSEITVSSDVAGDGWGRAAALCQDVLGYGGDAAIGDDGVLALGGNAAAGAAADATAQGSPA